MSEEASRLNLIQRAVKRAESVGTGSHAEPPHTEANDAARVQKLWHEGVVSAAAVAAATREPAAMDARADAAKPTLTARLKFNELRRQGMLTPDNLNTNIGFEFRLIKRKLLANARDPQTGALNRNLVMITSALPSEGKTFNATNLALSLTSEKDTRVLLIDGDVIHPSLTKLFECSNTLGLTDFLSDKSCTISDVTHNCSDIDNLSVIFAGARHELTPELISSRRTAELFAKLSADDPDRIVIIDTPPVLGSAETANLAPYMHQVLMVVAAAKATKHQVKSALEHVSSCPNVSLIFNKAAKWNKSAGYDYYYYGRTDSTRNNGG